MQNDQALLRSVAKQTMAYIRCVRVEKPKTKQ